MFFKVRSSGYCHELFNLPVSLPCTYVIKHVFDFFSLLIHLMSISPLDQPYEPGSFENNILGNKVCQAQFKHQDYISEEK